MPDFRKIQPILKNLLERPSDEVFRPFLVIFLGKELSMKHLMTSALSVLLMIGYSATASAENHFIFELTGGVASDVGIRAPVESGAAGSATFGIGGKIPGQTPAYYLIGRIGQSQFSFNSAPGAGGDFVYKRQQEWSLGGRVYLPITDRVRALAQVAVGQTFDDAFVSSTGSSVGLASSSLSVFGQTGVQARVTDKFSLGMAMDLAFYPERSSNQLAARDAYVGTDSQFGRLQIGATGTFHF